jgi:hypothetical protein
MRFRTVFGLLLGATLTLSALPSGSVFGQSGPQTRNTVLVGHFDPGGGFSADVWAHRNVAYMGSWGAGGWCPAHGVRAIDISKPTDPALLSVFASGAEFPETFTEEAWVGRIRTPFFNGDLAAVGVQTCDSSLAGRSDPTVFRGSALYDVTDPSAPELLGLYHTGDNTRGFHELRVVQRPDGRVLLMGGVVNSLPHTDNALGDFRIGDITDPRNPVEIADWDFRRDAPTELRERLLAERGAGQLWNHSALPFDNGMKAVAFMRDAGAVFFDISDPADPQFLGHTTYEPTDGGNAHSGAFFPNERLFVLSEEIAPPFEGQGVWGFQRIFDVSDLSNPVQISRFATDNALEPRLDGRYSAHNPMVRGRLLFSAWYSDGVRIVNLSDPTNPREVGFFVPPAAADPQGSDTVLAVAPDGNRVFPFVYGVFVAEDVVLASDSHSGLWIFRTRGLGRGAS